MKKPIAVYDASTGKVSLPDGTDVTEWYLVSTTKGLSEKDRPVRDFAQSACVTHHACLWLLAQRLWNGGNYGRADWHRLRAQRTRARTRLSLAAWRDGPLALAWGIGDRLRVRFDTGAFEYIAGQSENEELTNLMRRLVNPSAPYVS